MGQEVVRAGTVPFHIPSIDEACATYYKIFGDLASKQPPVIVIHGGPGSGHEYLLPYSQLWQHYGIPVILYDQIGCASSTHLRHKAGDEQFWTIELFVQQLDSFIDALRLREPGKPGYDILGHSFGGILGSYFATRRPKGLRKLILANSPASTDLHVVCLKLLWKELPQEAQHAVEEAERTGNFESQSYKDSELLLRRTFWSRADPFPPKELEQTIQNHVDDTTVTNTMYGTVPLQCTGTLHGWNCFSALPQINVPTLVYTGEFDLARAEAIAPYLTIPGVQKAMITGASHMSHLDNAEMLDKTLELASSFLLPDKSIKS